MSIRKKYHVYHPSLSPLIIKNLKINKTIYIYPNYYGKTEAEKIP